MDGWMDGPGGSGRMENKKCCEVRAWKVQIVIDGKKNLGQIMRSVLCWKI